MFWLKGICCNNITNSDEYIRMPVEIAENGPRYLLKNGRPIFCYGKNVYGMTILINHISFTKNRLRSNLVQMFSKGHKDVC